MDLSVLKKRLSTFKSPQGHLRTISNDVIFEVLSAWEQWPGTTADLYRELGIKKGQLSSIIRRAKKLVKSGALESDFKEVFVEEGNASNVIPFDGCCIELIWKNNNVIRFNSSDLLLDFLKKAA